VLVKPHYILWFNNAVDDLLLTSHDYISFLNLFSNPLDLLNVASSILRITFFYFYYKIIENVKGTKGISHIMTNLQLLKIKE